MNGSSDLKVSTALDYASGTAAREGAGLDMSLFQGVMMIVKAAAVAAGATYTIKAQQSDDDGVADGYSDLLGTSQTIAADDDDQIFIIDLIKPIKRYVRLYVSKDGANTCAESAVYVQYDARELPVTQTVADEVTYERHIEPAEGTA